MLAPLLLCWISTQAVPPTFDVHALGVLGGDDDSNLSAYAIGTPQRPAQLLVDAGAFTRGLEKWKGANALAPFVQSLTAVLVTHSHLDHVSGFVLTSPVLFSAGRTQPLPIIGLPQTTAALREHVFQSPLWVDFTRVPSKEAPAVTLNELPPGKPMTLGDFTVETVPLEHPVPSAAFLIGRGDAFYLHLGDTGPTDAVWKRARPLLANGSLRAIAVEVSFPTKDEALAKSSGHLTPALLLSELAKLTGTEATPKALGAALRGCRVVAIHIKASQYEKVVAELEPLSAAGLPLVIPQQGAGYSF
jgi:cAMP phosphodiesterase